MTNDPMDRSWNRLIATVEAVAALDDPTEEAVRAIVSSTAPDVTCDVRKDLVVLDLPADRDREGLAARLTTLGPAVGVDVVSPPPARPPWDAKRSIGHDLAGRRVWFGIEETGGLERLVSVSIRFDGPPAEHLPPAGREGPFRLTTSLGWCGGFGEAVLDEAGGIRRHDDLPIYVDGPGQDAILDRVDLAGSWRGAPVIRIAGRGRLERRRGRNTSIFGAPRESWVALVVGSLDEARVEGERSTGEETR